jgi:hypothetical protein
MTSTATPTPWRRCWPIRGRRTLTRSWSAATSCPVRSPALRLSDDRLLNGVRFANAGSVGPALRGRRRCTVAVDRGRHPRAAGTPPTTPAPPASACATRARSVELATARTSLGSMAAGVRFSRGSCEAEQIARLPSPGLQTWTGATRTIPIAFLSPAPRIRGRLKHLPASPAFALVQAFGLRGVRVAAGVEWVEFRRRSNLSDRPGAYMD